MEELRDEARQVQLLELRIRAHRLSARELLEEGTDAAKELAGRFIRGAELLEADLRILRERQRTVAAVPHAVLHRPGGTP